jgi:type I restriction enzyme, R subunit
LIKQFKDPSKEPHIAVSVDMMDTGIDVREIVNLVFFKRVRSRIKFWQMIGRGARIRPDLFVKGQDKEYFYIFDYLGNFEYFRENKNGIEATLTASTQASIFAMRVKLIFHLRDATFIGDDYQDLRDALMKEVSEQIASLQIDRVDVMMKRKYVDKFRSKSAFVCLTEQDKAELIGNIADLVTMNDIDDKVVEFDNLMYGLMLAQLEGSKTLTKFKNATISRANILLKKATIPQVKAKIPLIKEVTEDEFWEGADILSFEKIRKELRDLMKFAVLEGRGIVYTNLKDAVMKAFSSFINEQSLNANQIVLVNKVIDYIEQNGYLENLTEHTKPPFDKPQSFIKLFDPDKQKKFVQVINEAKENAVRVIS